MITNSHGDVCELLDANGNAFAAYHYDAWGLPQGTGSYTTGIWTASTSLISSTLAGQIASEQVLRYASYVYDPESGLYYCSARYYDPATRQWTTADSAKADGEESAYQYCEGRPVTGADRTGLGVLEGSTLTGSVPECAPGTTVDMGTTTNSTTSSSTAKPFLYYHEQTIRSSYLGTYTYVTAEWQTYSWSGGIASAYAYPWGAEAGILLHYAPLSAYRSSGYGSYSHSVGLGDDDWDGQALAHFKTDAAMRDAEYSAAGLMLLVQEYPGAAAMITYDGSFSIIVDVHIHRSACSFSSHVIADV